VNSFSNLFQIGLILGNLQEINGVYIGTDYWRYLLFLLGNWLFHWQTWLSDSLCFSHTIIPLIASFSWLLITLSFFILEVVVYPRTWRLSFRLCSFHWIRLSLWWLSFLITFIAWRLPPILVPSLLQRFSSLPHSFLSLLLTSSCLEQPAIGRSSSIPRRSVLKWGGIFVPTLSPSFQWCLICLSSFCRGLVCSSLRRCPNFGWFSISLIERLSLEPLPFNRWIRVRSTSVFIPLPAVPLFWSHIATISIICPPLIRKTSISLLIDSSPTIFPLFVCVRRIISRPSLGGSFITNSFESWFELHWQLFYLFLQFIFSKPRLL